MVARDPRVGDELLTHAPPTGRIIWSSHFAFSFRDVRMCTVHIVQLALRHTAYPFGDDKLVIPGVHCRRYLWPNRRVLATATRPALTKLFFC